MANNYKRIPAKGDVYEHYKGNLYYVIGHAHDTETGGILVLYKHFNQKNNQHAFLWARPIDIWSKQVNDHGTIKERFKLRTDLMGVKR